MVGNVPESLAGVYGLPFLASAGEDTMRNLILEELKRLGMDKKAAYGLMGYGFSRFMA